MELHTSDNALPVKMPSCLERLIGQTSPSDRITIPSSYFFNLFENASTAKISQFCCPISETCQWTVQLNPHKKQNTRTIPTKRCVNTYIANLSQEQRNDIPKRKYSEKKKDAPIKRIKLALKRKSGEMEWKVKNENKSISKFESQTKAHADKIGAEYSNELEIGNMNLSDVFQSVSESRSLESVCEKRSGESVSENWSGESVSENWSGESVSEIRSGESVSEIRSGESVPEIRSGESVPENRSEESVSEKRSVEVVSENKSGESVSENRSRQSVPENWLRESASEIDKLDSAGEFRNYFMWRMPLVRNTNSPLKIFSWDDSSAVAYLNEKKKQLTQFLEENNGELPATEDLNQHTQSSTPSNISKSGHPYTLQDQLEAIPKESASPFRKETKWPADSVSMESILNVSYGSFKKTLPFFDIPPRQLDPLIDDIVSTLFNSRDNDVECTPSDKLSPPIHKRKETVKC